MDDITSFEWDELKNILNQAKHGVDFKDAQRAFLDPHRLLIDDPKHSESEKRFFCLGFVHGVGVVTVRFIYRDGKVRIFGAGVWRKGRARYYAERRS